MKKLSLLVQLNTTSLFLYKPDSRIKPDDYARWISCISISIICIFQFRIIHVTDLTNKKNNKTVLMVFLITRDRVTLMSGFCYCFRARPPWIYNFFYWGGGGFPMFICVCNLYPGRLVFLKIRAALPSSFFKII